MIPINPISIQPKLRLQDGRLTVEKYERSAEEDEAFGIDHLRLHAGEGEEEICIGENENSEEEPSADAA